MKIVKVTWKDISGISLEENMAWHSSEQLLEAAQTDYDTDYVSIGVIVHQNDDFLVIAATYDCGDKIMYSDASMIPMAVVTKIEDLNVTTTI